MFFTCKCLNFSIVTSGNAEPADSSTIKELSNFAQSQELLLVTYQTISKKVDIIVALVRQNEWTEYHCRNCSMWVYATRVRDSGHRAVVNQSCLLSSEEIETMKRHPKYSNIFKVILYHEDREDASVVSDDPLHPVACSWLQEQKRVAEALIRNFADQQYHELETKKLRAISDHCALKRAVAHDIKLHAPVQKTLQHSFVALAKPSTSTPKVSKSPPKKPPPTVEKSLSDIQDPILLEAKSSHELLSEGSSDDEPMDARESRHPAEPAMARSLPIPVPRFLDEPRHHDPRLDDQAQTPTDIHANMRALARSLHGNPVFGELPRPPCSKK